MQKKNIFIIIELAVFFGVMLFFAGCTLNDEDTEQTGAAEENTSGAESGNKEENKTYVNEEYGFTLEYPADWIINTEMSTSSSVVFYPPGKAPSKEYEYVGEIIVEVWKNPENVDLILFFRQKDGTDLSYAYETVFDIQTNGWTGKKFSGVYGMTSSTIALLSHGDIIIAVTDINEIHQTDGVFDIILNTLKFH